jgi:D-3-phosphoglycerate dehydrogenase / 2-oxoglutarate reductase
MKENELNIIFDFDSTFVKLEALDELAGIALRKKKNRKALLQEIKKTTNLGMEGLISFPESLSRRFRLLSANKKNIASLIKLLKNNVSDSIENNKSFFIKNSKNIYIISGGFKEYIFPVVSHFGIRRENVLANNFIFDQLGNITGFDKRQLLSKKNGKVKQLKKMKLVGKVWVIGDGWTDYQIRENGLADKFIAFFENVERDNIAEKADQVVKNFDEFLMLNNLK